MKFTSSLFNVEGTAGNVVHRDSTEKFAEPLRVQGSRGNDQLEISTVLWRFHTKQNTHTHRYRYIIWNWNKTKWFSETSDGLGGAGGCCCVHTSSIQQHLWNHPSLTAANGDPNSTTSKDDEKTCNGSPQFSKAPSNSDTGNASEASSPGDNVPHKNEQHGPYLVFHLEVQRTQQGKSVWAITTATGDDNNTTPGHNSTTGKYC